MKILTGNDLKTGAVTWWNGHDWSLHVEDAVDVGDRGDAVAEQHLLRLVVVAPGCGVAEDPATGSAHCILGPLYADRLGRPDVRFRQVFPGRGGEIETETRDPAASRSRS